MCSSAIDTIEHVLRQTGSLITGSEGYVVAYRLAEDNLRLGLNVVADSVNPLQITRTAWREVALHANVPFVEIEVICSDIAEHQHRVETRFADISGFKLPTWDAVVNRSYEPWDTERFVIDTAGQTVEQSVISLRRIWKRLRDSAFCWLDLIQESSLKAISIKRNCKANDQLKNG